MRQRYISDDDEKCRGDFTNLPRLREWLARVIETICVAFWHETRIFDGDIVIERGTLNGSMLLPSRLQPSNLREFLSLTP